MDAEIRMLLGRVEEVDRAVGAAVARCTEGRLHPPCPAERCTVAALACHVADTYALGADWVRKVLAGEPLPPVTADTVDQVNAQGFARDAYRTRRETLARLRRHGAEATEVLRSLGDADLDRTSPFTLFGGPMTSVGEMIERVLIADPESHLRSIRAAIGPDAPTSGVWGGHVVPVPPDGE